MKELLQRYGFTYEGNCQCDGFQTEKYKNGEYQLRVRVRKDQFKIKKGVISITIWNPLKDLQQTLQNITSTVNA